MKKERVILAVMILFIASFVFARGPGEGYEMGPGMMWGYGMGWLWTLIMIVFAIVFVLGIIMLIRWVVSSAEKSRGVRSEESALDILKKRYAGGEIEKETFEEMKRDLEK